MRAELARVPGGANVISSDEYADGRASTLADLFALAPGVLAQPRFGAEEARLSIRGSGLQRTFHMRGINLLQDGVPLTLADGSGDFQAIDEVDSRGSASRVRWDVVAYWSRVRNELLSLNSPEGQPLGTVNAPRTIHRGVEAGLAMELLPSLLWQSSWLWTDLKFDDNATYGDNRLPGIPEHFYRGELRHQLRDVYYVTLTTEWSPRDYAIDMANSFFAESCAIWGLKAGREVADGVSWFVEGRNLADRRYAATTGVIADARGQDSAQFLPGDGRAVYVGIEWKRRDAR